MTPGPANRTEFVRPAKRSRRKNMIEIVYAFVARCENKYGKICLCAKRDYAINIFGPCTRSYRILFEKNAGAFCRIACVRYIDPDRLFKLLLRVEDRADIIMRPFRYSDDEKTNNEWSMSKECTRRKKCPNPSEARIIRLWWKWDKKGSHLRDFSRTNETFRSIFSMILSKSVQWDKYAPVCRRLGLFPIVEQIGFHRSVFKHLWMCITIYYST